jgi:hypothetical protein
MPLEAIFEALMPLESLEILQSPWCIRCLLQFVWLIISFPHLFYLPLIVLFLISYWNR